jgi:carbon monoxide dehydrogenase subunit G
LHILKNKKSCAISAQRIVSAAPVCKHRFEVMLPADGCCGGGRVEVVMKVEGEISVDAPRDVVFNRLSDAPFFASCIDGVSDLTAIDDTHYTATFATRVAYMRFTFKVAVEMTQVEPPDTIQAKVEGTPVGVVGRLTATASTKLVETGSTTTIRYLIDATLTGKLGSIGEPVLRSKARDMEKQFTKNLLAAFASGGAEKAQ